MKSFFQRFHDSQPGTSKPRTRDATYRQWIPSSKPDKDRTQSPNGAEPNTNASTKRHATKTAGPRSSDDTRTGALGRVPADYSTRFSTFPGLSTNRHAPANLPHQETYTFRPSTSTAANVNPPEDVKERDKPPVKRNEAAELSGNDRDAEARVKFERPSRSGQPPAPSVPQQPQIWLPEVQIRSKEKGKKKDRRRQGDESDGGGLQLQASSGYRDDRSPDSGAEREMEGSNRRRMELKEKEQGTGARHRNQVIKESQQWEQQEKDMRQLRPGGVHEKERPKVRKERERAKEKDKDKDKERGKEKERLKRERDRDKEEDKGKEKAKDKENDRKKEKDKDRENDKTLRELWEKEQRQKLQREKEARDRQLQLEKEQREQQEKERRAKEERERERKERKAKERQAERERLACEQLEMEHKERLERERREKEQKEREHDQQKKWEREQDELERRELERLEKDRLKEERRRKDQESRQREPDTREMDLLRLERERQEQRKRDREMWEQHREREREERERRWRGDRFREVPEPIPSDTGANDKGSIRLRRKDRKDGLSDSEREQGKVQGQDQGRALRIVTQANTPPRPEDRKIQNTEGPRSSDHTVKPRRSMQYITPDMPNPLRQYSKSSARDDGYVSEKNQNQSSRDQSGRGVPTPEIFNIMATSSTQHAQLPVPANTAHSSNPPGYVPFGSSSYVLSAEHSGSPAPTGFASQPVYYSVVRVPGPDSCNQAPSEAPPQLINRPTTSALQVQHPLQQSYPAPNSQPQTSYSASISSRAPPPTELTLHNPRPMELTTMGSSLTRAPEITPQEIRILSPSAATQASQSNVPSALQNSLSLLQEARLTKEHRLTGHGVLTAPSLAAATTQNAHPKVLHPHEDSTMGARSSPPNRRPEPHASSVQDTIAFPSQTAQPMPPLHSAPSVPFIQQNHPPATSTKPPSTFSSQHPIKYPSLSPKEDIALLGRQVQESPEHGGFHQKDSIPQIPPTQSTPLVLSGTTTSKHVAINKRSNTMPSQSEPHPDLVPPPDNLRGAYTSRQSPSHTHGKIQDDVSGPIETIILPAAKLDPPSRVSPPTDKISLQGSTTLRQHLSDKSNNQDSRPQQTVQPVATSPMATENHEIATDKDRNQGGYRLQVPLPVDSRAMAHSRRQRYPSESETSRRGGKHSPRSQPVESPDNLNPQQTPGELQPKVIQPSAGHARAGSDAKVALRVPAVDSTSADKRHPGSGPRPTTGGSLQDAGAYQVPPQPGQNGSSVSNLVSQFERLGGAAHVGSTIVRPGTAVPRTNVLQPPVHEPSSRFKAAVPLIGHSQSVSYPQIDRPSTTIGIRPSVSSAPQSQSRNAHPAPPKMDRVGKLELLSFPDKTPQPTTSQPAITEARHEPVPPQTMNGQYSTLQTIPEAQTALGPNDYHHPRSRLQADVPIPSQKISHSERALKEVSPKPRSGTSVAEVNNEVLITRAAPSAEVVKLMGTPHPQCAPQTHEDKISARQSTMNNEGYGTSQLQSAYPTPPQSYSNPVVRRDDTGNSTRYSPGTPHLSTQPRPRKESSPRIRPEDNLLKVPGGKETPAEDPRVVPHRANHASGDTRVAAPTVDSHYTSYRTEPVRGEINQHLSSSTQKHASEMGTPPSQRAAPSTQHLSFDDRSRGKDTVGSYSPNVPQRCPPVSVDLASISPQRTGNSTHSKPEEEGLSGSQKLPVQVKDARLAELLSPPKANDVPHQSYLQGARRSLASKLEQQPNGIPNSISGNSGSNIETTSRLRNPSSRSEHSPKHPEEDSSPSGPSNPSPSHSQNPDLSIKDNTYVRTSPNISQHTPSPRARLMVAESQSQPGTQYRDEISRHGPGASASRQLPTRERRQDYAPDMEDRHPRTYHQTTTYATYHGEARTNDTNRKSHIPSNPIPYQAWDQHAGRTRSGHRRDTSDSTQPITIAHSRTGSDSQNPQEDSAPYSRHTYSHNAASSQAQPSPHTSAPSHIPPASALTIQMAERPSDQMPYYHPNQTQIPILGGEDPVPQQVTQALPMKSTPSKRNYIASLPPETHNTSSSSAPQPPTPRSYEVWLPPISSRDTQRQSRSTVTPSSHREFGRERDHARRTSTVPRAHKPSPPRDSRYLRQPPASDPRLSKPYHYLKTRKVRTMSLASVEAQDGAASTVIGSPTTSILSQAPLNIPPEQDPMVAAREWTEAGAIVPGQRIRRPGLVWADPEDPPLTYQQEHRRPEPRSSRPRRSRLSGSRSREASDSDQPPSS